MQRPMPAHARVDGRTGSKVTLLALTQNPVTLVMRGSHNRLATNDGALIAHHEQLVGSRGHTRDRKCRGKKKESPVSQQVAHALAPTPRCCVA
jgi:hypothetical protein